MLSNGNSDFSKLNNSNAEFWNELCGTHAAKKLGINEVTLDNLKKFDEWYFDYYPYLKKLIDKNLKKIYIYLKLDLGMDL